MPEIFQLDFMVRALVAGGMTGLSAPLLGTFLVLRRLSLIADTLAHVAIAGAAVGLFFRPFSGAGGPFWPRLWLPWYWNGFGP